ncbi:MAG: threonine synthase [Actinomycetia bacterium]|nr:threonine synthase [Actinomycetes bacterium]
MRYVSTRGQAPVLGFRDVLLEGLARDGGLYVPEAWPTIEAMATGGFAGRPYVEVATEIMAPFVEPDLGRDELGQLVEAAYSSFHDPDIVPLRELGDGHWLLELFHGPTLAFKDVALQLVGRLFDHELTARGKRVTVVGATSGDTGSAAIEALADLASVEVIILHPRGRVSEVQRRQMTTVVADNVHNVAVQGTFDDCQDLVKAMFADTEFRSRVGLSAVNSINWARVMAQIVYYATAAARVAPGAPVSFSVPTGNFGNVFAGWAAAQGGLPIDQLVVASNRNDILTRFLETGEMRADGVVASLSPSMDIQVSSNFERLLFEAVDRDGESVDRLLTEFRATGAFGLESDAFDRIADRLTGHRLDDDGTLATIGQIHDELGILVDPHTAVGIAAARACRADPNVPMVTLATAHPAKFPDAVEQATGARPELPPFLAELMDRPERLTPLDNDLTTVEDFVITASGR